MRMVVVVVVGGWVRRCHRQVELELSWQLVLAVESVGEVDPSQAAVGVHRHSHRLHVVRPVGPLGELGQIEADLVPVVVQP